MNAISRRMKLFCIAVRQLTFVNIGAHEKWVLAERFLFLHVRCVPSDIVWCSETIYNSAELDTPQPLCPVE